MPSVSACSGADGDRLVVETADAALRRALAELWFAEGEDGRFTKRFPAGSLTEPIVARFRALAPALLRQAARLEPAPWRSALCAAARRLDAGGVDWWLTGSGALAARGAAVEPRDLDLVVPAEGVAAVFGDVLIEPETPAEGWFCARFGRAWLGARVEWVAGVTAAADEPEESDFGPAAAAALEQARRDGLRVRVPPLGLQRAVCERRGLAGRVAAIDALAAA